MDVRIQDRGPFIRGRIIDLSHAAAREIEMIGPGITKVKLTVIAPPRNTLSASLNSLPCRSAPSVTRRAPIAHSEEMKQRFGARRVVERGGESAGLSRPRRRVSKPRNRPKRPRHRSAARAASVLVVRLDRLVEKISAAAEPSTGRLDAIPRSMRCHHVPYRQLTQGPEHPPSDEKG